METWTTRVLCEAAHVTFRQADYWCRQGILVETVPANGSGSQRRFNLAEVRIAWVLGKASEAGVQVSRVDTDVLRLDWGGWLVVAHEIGSELVKDRAGLGTWPVETVIDLAYGPDERTIAAAKAKVGSRFDYERAEGWR